MFVTNPINLSDPAVNGWEAMIVSSADAADVIISEIRKRINSGFWNNNGYSLDDAIEYVCEANNIDGTILNDYDFDRIYKVLKFYF